MNVIVQLYHGDRYVKAKIPNARAVTRDRKIPGLVTIVHSNGVSTSQYYRPAAVLADVDLEEHGV